MTDHQQPSLLTIHWQAPNFRTVNKFYKLNGHKGKASGTDRVYVAVLIEQAIETLPSLSKELAINLCQNGELNPNYLVGALRLCGTEQPNAALLRSMWISKSHRSNGLGAYLLDRSIRTEQQRKQFDWLYCYPYKHLIGFYQRAQFQLIGSDDALPIPAELNAQYQRYLQRGEKILFMGRSVR